MLMIILLFVSIAVSAHFEYKKALSFIASIIAVYAIVITTYILTFTSAGKTTTIVADLDFYVQADNETEVWVKENDNAVKYDNKGLFDIIEAEYNPDLPHSQVTIVKTEYTTIQKVLFFAFNREEITIQFNNSADYVKYKQ